MGVWVKTNHQSNHTTNNSSYPKKKKTLITMIIIPSFIGLITKSLIPVS